MGKIIASVSTTLDGAFTGPSGDEDNMVSWAMPGVIDAMDDNLAMFQKAEALLMGRVTYTGFATYWPYQEGAWADAMNKTPKYVASRNKELQDVQWGDYNDTIFLLDGGLSQAVSKLKSEINGSIVIPASADLIQSLMNAGLVDELSMIVHPVILGSGRRYFENMADRHDMKLLSTKLYETSGSIRLRYEIIKKKSRIG
ncbi:dihydrofolate reductase [Bacillus sp. FJAT-49705]|uniref:Dihydrofolate reductase n=1 Tax=Cytobacillus citreus TaxID=2833586 RepID=A0ABS5NXF6_9BACI|nr:dihydrofolate reductase family protein [Cytobacillus citreus]MBS4192534.1 dihydrofolate reductase [Cytobacillus citreus]